MRSRNRIPDRNGNGSPLPPPEESPARTLTFRFRESFKWKQAFHALRYPNYRLWFWGQVISLFGTWMQLTAQGFLIYELTHSPAYLGYTAFAAGVPTWLFMLYGGVLADRIHRRTLLIITQIAMMVLAVVLALLTFLGIVEAWHIVLLAFGLGIATAFDAPARQAFVQELVDREDMPNAIAMNSAMFNLATSLGPGVSGVIYVLVGPAWCFIINAVSYLAIIVALAAMRLQPLPPAEHRHPAGVELWEGIRFLRGHAMIKTLISIVAVTCFFGLSFATLIPAWAVKILGGNATTNGMLQSFRGFGAFCGALMIASLGRFQFKGRLLTVGGFAFPLLLLSFGVFHQLVPALVILFLIGVSIMLIFNLGNALVQTLVPDKLRGRVMGVYSLAFFGLMPLGALWVGLLAEHLSEPLAVVINGGILLVFFVLIRIFVPRIYDLP